jgi:hypothetical protein
VRVERRHVRTEKGQAPEERCCLVVRVDHPPGNPFMARLEGLPEPAGVEHRFYSRADRYVGVFWFAERDTEERMQDRLGELAGLQLLSVAGLKQEAAVRGHLAEFTGLSVPATVPPRPQPLIRLDEGPALP